VRFVGCNPNVSSPSKGSLTLRTTDFGAIAIVGASEVVLLGIENPRKDSPEMGMSEPSTVGDDHSVIVDLGDEFSNAFGSRKGCNSWSATGLRTTSE
jgi:hypothetical protein